ncbi:MAG: hypothetical protein M3R64_09840 [Pseudomonadota bacterium]|nr:hypothetical protein [Pseudomonadota bacterium]
MSEVDDAIAAARSSWARISSADDGLFAPTERRATATHAIGQRMTRIAIADGAILVAAVVIGMFLPLGIMGALLFMALLVAATVTLAVWPAENRAPPPPEKLRTVDIKILPAQTQRWLAAQRQTLPAAARGVAEKIAARLAILSPQLGKIDPDTEAAFELRRLIGEQLPAFVNDYAQVPATLRTTARNGKTPDAELVDGLTLIEREIADMTERLAQGDLDSLATRGRFLEMKYRGDADTHQ